MKTVKSPRKYNYTMKTGRPAMFKSPEELEKKIEQYFKDGYYKRKSVGPFGNEIEIPSPGITDLALYLGFVDRHSMYAYESLPQFSNTIKKARAQIERIYESMLHSGSCTGAIFALKNFGWKDKFEHEVEVGDKTLEKLAEISTDQLQKRAYELAGGRSQNLN